MKTRKADPKGFPVRPDCELNFVSLGAALKLARTSLNFSMAELADAAGIALSHVWNIERGKKEMSLRIFVRICAMLNLSPEHLIITNIHPSSFPSFSSVKTQKS